MILLAELVRMKVVGMAGRESDAWSVSAQYQKHQFLTRNLSANLSLSHTWDHSLTVDTAYRHYDWNGDYIVSSRNEITSRGASMRHYKRPLTIARADFGYLLAEGHLLNLTYSLNRTGNDRYDDVDRDFTPSNDVLAKHIFGLSYNQTLLGGRMSNTLFVKDYLNHLTVEQTDIQSVTGSKDMQGSNTSNHLGFGVGSKFQIVEPIAVKASYENSVRLPLARELLGNGTTIYANVTLKPEESHNANLGLFGTLRSGDHTLSYEVNGFLRQVDNYIQANVSEKEGMMQYVNVPAVHIKGAETELRYNWMQKAIHKVQSLPQPTSHNYSEGEQVLLFGITYSLHIQEIKPKEKAFVSIGGSIITLHINPDSSQKKREMLLHAFYKERLSMVVSVYMNDYQSKLKCNPIPFRILHRKSVWGTFNPRKRSIVFNINLAQVPLECVQYVVLHEMTHQYVPAHNADFYNKMAVFMPDWKERRTRLKQFGHHATKKQGKNAKQENMLVDTHKADL